MVLDGGEDVPTAAKLMSNGEPHSLRVERDPAFRAFQEERTAHWNHVARRLQGHRRWGAYYHRRLATVFQRFISPGLSVLEIGCAEGDLLSSMNPRFGVGVDFSVEMIRLAAARHPELCLVQADGHTLPLSGTFDIIILSDLLNDVWDVQQILGEVARLSRATTRVWITSYNRLWEIPLSLVSRLGLAHPNLHQNWLTLEDIRNLLYLARFEFIRSWQEVLWPVGTAILEPLFNRFFVALWPVRHLGLTNVIVARPWPVRGARGSRPSVSIVIPVRNEAGNIPELLRRLPRIASEQEVLFIEGHSKDDTYEAVTQAIASHPQWDCQLLRQPGIGKGDAVREGFARARGEILMILDADLSVPPEDLVRFYEVLVEGKAELANGVRLVYPMEGEAMRFFNLVGNKLFSLAFSWLIGQPVKDTLCGTKALWKADYQLIAADRGAFGQADPFGDFDLLLGAARHHLRIVDVPIRYRRRTYGKTNISRWKHGAALLSMIDQAARRLRFF